MTTIFGTYINIHDVRDVTIRRRGSSVDLVIHSKPQNSGGLDVDRETEITLYSADRNIPITFTQEPTLQ